MTDQKVLYYPEFQGGSAMSSPIVHRCPYDIVKVQLKMRVFAGGTVYIGALGNCIKTAADYGDLEDFEVTGDEVATGMFIVLDTLDNIKLLKKNNGVYAATKKLFFSAGAMIDVMILIPGSIIEVRLNNAEASPVKPGLMLYFAALGGVKLEDGCSYLDNLGKALCQVAVSTSDELIIIMVTW